ncbi:Fanconi anemia group I protein [Cimex lectularius]|uniref:Fanconi anemia group I protein n=1 Tax=Cimex lectularius TaxID=79782 RepID=A0A8I6RV81_CIMLE|nr:Fanconi anemia group I protein [Cimex lectularius]
MDEDALVENLMQLFGKRRKSEEDLKSFVDFVEELDYKTLERLVKSRVHFSGGPQVINALFSGLSLKNPSQKKRIKLFELLLKEFHSGELPSKNVSAILVWLAMEVDKLSDVHVIRICDLCVEYVSKSETDRQTSWKDLLPKLLSVVVKKNIIDHYGTDMTGEAYKKQVINALCQPNWNSAVLCSVASMFVHIPLNQEEHAKITNKLCLKIQELAPEEVPSITHQLLNLTKNQGAMPLFFALKKYYNKRIYHLDDSSCMLDSDKVALKQLDSQHDINVSVKDVNDSQAMVLYHIEQAAKRSLNCITELIKNAKTCVPCSEVMFDPFTLSVLLIISNISHLETQVMDVMKNMVVKLLIEEQKRFESDWLRKILNTFCNVEGVIIKLIKSGTCEIEAVLRGLVSLSMVLLKTATKGDKVSQAVSRFGRMIAVNIFIKHSPVARTLLSSISTNIMSSPLIIQFTDCLGELCDNSPLLVLEHVDVLNHLLEALPSFPQSTACRILYSLISLLRVSSKLRDNLTLILRKSLFLHDIGARRVAVSGFLQLLKRLKISGMHSLSQNSFQAYTCPSVFTQTVIDVHTQPANNFQENNGNNEGLCLEIINILKRCFSQQLAIKVTLYTGLNRVIIKNSELCLPVIEVFLEHLGEYFETSNDKIPPLNFDKAISVTDTEVVIKEPLGHLVFLMQQIIVTSDSMITAIEGDYEFSANRTKLCKIMDLLVGGFSKCELTHLEIEDDTAGLERKLKEEKLCQFVNVYQALIAYIICKWDVNKTSEDVKKLMALFRAYSQFEEFSKNYKPPKNDLSQKKKSKDMSVAVVSGKKQQFSLNETVFDFSTVYRMLSLILCESVDWCLDDVIAEMKGKRVFHRFILQSSLDVLHKTKNKLAEEKSHTTFSEVTKLANLIFNKVLLLFKEVMDFDPVSTVLGVEIFNECCSLVMSYYKRRFEKFLQEVIGTNEELGLDKLLENVLKPYLKNLSKAMDCDEDEAGDANTKLLVTTLITGVNLLSLELPVDGLCINKVYRWLLDLCLTKTLNSTQNVKTLITLLLTLLIRCKREATLHDNLALQLCTLFSTITDEEIEKGTVNLMLVNDATKISIFPILCQSLNIRLDAVEWVITRVKAEIALISQPDAAQTEPQARKEVLKRKEKEIVTELGLIVSAIQWLCMAAIPQECAETTCKLLHHAYSCLSSFTKYFMMRGDQCYQEAKFSKLVKLAATNLSTQIADFLLYIESIDHDENTKKISNKMLRQAKKQTVYIPKLVSELENFTKCVTLLSKKSKDPTLVLNVKLTTTRDFRLNTKKLQEVMRDHNDVDYDDETSSNGVASQLSANGNEFPGAAIEQESPQPGPSRLNKKRKSQNVKTSNKKRKTK